MTSSRSPESFRLVVVATMSWSACTWGWVDAVSSEEEPQAATTRTSERDESL